MYKSATVYIIKRAPQIINLKVLTSRVIPKFSKKDPKYLSKEKCIFDHEKYENRKFCQARMLGYELGYLWVGLVQASTRSTLVDKNHTYIETSKIRGPLYVFKTNVINFLGYLLRTSQGQDDPFEAIM